MLNDNDINWGTPYWERGRLEGQAELLLLQLENKFGPLPEHRRARVTSATQEELVAWGLRFDSADSLDAVLGPDPEVQ